MTTRTFQINVVAASPYPQWYMQAGLDTAAPGTVVEITGGSASLIANDSTGSKPFQAPPYPGSTLTGSLDWCSNLPYCPTTKRVMVAGGRPSLAPAPNHPGAAQKLIYFNVWSGTSGGNTTEGAWDSVANPFLATGGHLYQSQCVAESIRRFFYVNISGDNIVRLWNTQTWEAAGTLPAIPSSIRDALCLMWMPNLGTQGSLIAAGSWDNVQRAYRFDWASQGPWTEVAGSSAPFVTGTPSHFAGVYVPQAGACIYGRASGGGSLRVINADGSVTVTPSSHPGYIGVFDGYGILTPHPSAAKAIHFCPATNKVWTYEFSSNTWVDRGTIPPAFDVRYQAGATIPDLGVVLSVSGGNVEAVGRTMWAYKVPAWA